MAVKITRIISQGELLGMEFKISRKQYGYMAQEIFRALMHMYLSRESSFGFDNNYSEILEFDYICGERNTNQILYDGNINQFKHSRIKAPVSPNV